MAPPPVARRQILCRPDPGSAALRGSILVAPDIAFLPRRFNGFVQLTYSILIGYSLYLTVSQGTRQQIARLFLCALIILVGCLLETYGGLRPISDSVRKVPYSRGLYENDLRDMILYKRVRPKFFASEPASVTFCYSLFSFVWFVVSRMRLKLALYVALMAAGIFAMPGPDPAPDAAAGPAVHAVPG